MDVSDITYASLMSNKEYLQETDVTHIRIFILVLTLVNLTCSDTFILYKQDESFITLYIQLNNVELIHYYLNYQDF